MTNTPLNYKDLSILIEHFKEKLPTLRFEKIIVPKLKNHPTGYEKNLFVFRFESEKGPFHLWVHLQPPLYLYWKSGKGPQASTNAPQSPFQLQINKKLSGKVLHEFDVLLNDRRVLLIFGKSKIDGLLFQLIPSRPQLFDVEIKDQNLKIRNALKKNTLEIISREESRNTPDLKSRFSDQESIETWIREIEDHRNFSYFLPHLQKIRNTIKKQEKTIQKQIEKLQQSLKHSQNEPPWEKYGNLLKAVFHENPPLQNGVRTVYDYETEENIQIPGKEKSITKEIERYFHLSKRTKTRIKETTSRIEELQNKKKNLESIKNTHLWIFEDKVPENWKTKVDLVYEILAIKKESSSDFKNKKKWSGPTFLSSDQTPIYVGRNLKENLNLTLRFAKGNDLWLHIKNRPSAHLVIELQKNKTASLQTLNEAAQLLLHYSGGKQWGKIEIDYTFQKYVKRIKKSNKITYSQNKTLWIEFDPECFEKVYQNKIN